MPRFWIRTFPLRSSDDQLRTGAKKTRLSKDIADASYTLQRSSVRLRRFRAHSLDPDRYLDGAGMLEGERQGKSIAYSQRLC